MTLHRFFNIQFHNLCLKNIPDLQIGDCQFHLPILCLAADRLLGCGLPKEESFDIRVTRYLTNSQSIAIASASVCNI